LQFRDSFISAHRAKALSYPDAEPADLVAARQIRRPKEADPDLPQDAVVARALDYCCQAMGKGVLAIRGHVGATDPSFHTVKALLEVRDVIRGKMDLQLVAFPQDGWFRAAGAEAQLIRALDAGVEILGGIRHFERSMVDGVAAVRAACRVAAERGLMVDLPCDESDDPLSRHIATMAATTIDFGLQGRVTGSHPNSMRSMDNHHGTKLIPLNAEAHVSAIANPLINITLHDRADTYPKRPGVTRVRTGGVLPDEIEGSLFGGFEPVSDGGSGLAFPVGDADPVQDPGPGETRLCVGICHRGDRQHVDDDLRVFASQIGG